MKKSQCSMFLMHFLAPLVRCKVLARWCAICPDKSAQGCELSCANLGGSTGSRNWTAEQGSVSWVSVAHVPGKFGECSMWHRIMN